MKRISLRNADGKQIFSVAIKSFKKDRAYILGLFRALPEAVCLETNVRRYTASDIYAGRFGKAI